MHVYISASFKQFCVFVDPAACHSLSMIKISSLYCEAMVDYTNKLSRLKPVNSIKTWSSLAEAYRSEPLQVARSVICRELVSRYHFLFLLNQAVREL